MGSVSEDQLTNVPAAVWLLLSWSGLQPRGVHEILFQDTSVSLFHVVRPELS